MGCPPSHDSISDLCCSSISEKGLESKSEGEKQKIKPALMVREEMQDYPSRTWRALMKVAKDLVGKEDMKTRIAF